MMSRKHVSTRRRLHIEALEDRLCLSALPVGTSTTVPDAATQAHLTASYHQLPLSFEVNPGADPHAIRLAFAGAQGKSIDAQGNLVLHTSGGDLVEHAPVAYQTINGVRHHVTSRFVIGRGGQVGFTVGHYDRSRALV